MPRFSVSDLVIDFVMVSVMPRFSVSDLVIDFVMVSVMPRAPVELEETPDAYGVKLRTIMLTNSKEYHLKNDFNTCQYINNI